MVYDQIFRVYTKFLRLQEFRKWKLKEISSYDKKYIYIYFLLSFADKRDESQLLWPLFIMVT